VPPANDPEKDRPVASFSKDDVEVPLRIRKRSSTWMMPIVAHDW
jgi:hypothetical protein